MAEVLTIGQIYNDNRSKLKLHCINGDIGHDRVVTSTKMNRPGLELTGFWEYFDNRRIQVIGLKEKHYCNTLSEEKLGCTFEKLFKSKIPALVFAHRVQPPKIVIELAKRNRVALFKTSMLTSDFISFLVDYLDWELAPSVIVHGSLVDVYGVGLLFTGRSGIGKSEIALDLVERGHRLVADDVVKLIRRADNVIIGKSVELLEHNIEVRGLGIINVQSIFGIRAIRQQKRLEVQVELVDWSETENYERIGTTGQYTNVLDVNIPLVKLPIYPGKNITVISEVIALNHILKVMGKDAAKDFQKKLLSKIKEKSKMNELQIYLKKDFE
jgi:HPr kinase/phosphorylase